jgi:hypothetical protein
MNRTISIILVILGFGGAGTMYYLGSNSSHLSELMDFYYYVIPLGAFGLFNLFKPKKESEK